MKDNRFQFTPEKSGFLAWTCKVKMPGKPNQYNEVRALTKRGAKRKAERLHRDLVAAYSHQAGVPKKGKTITVDIPELPPDAPKWVDTSRPRPSGGPRKPLEDEAITRKINNRLPHYHTHDDYNIISGEVERRCEVCRSDNWVAFSDSRGDLVISCSDCGKVQTSIKSI